MNTAQVLILDFGSQYTQLITRRIRECEVHSALLPGNAALEKIQEKKPQAIILSGGPSSVYEKTAPELARGFWEWVDEEKIPVLGICYGMQIMSKNLGGVVSPGKTREYGRNRAQFVPQSLLCSGESPSVWMSHGDEVSRPPKGFLVSALSENGKIAAMENVHKKLFGLQFHPEVTHTENGIKLIQSFLFKIARLKPEWKMASFKEDMVAKIRETVGPTAHVVCGLSGGVDSTVAAQLVHLAIGDRLHCVFVDHGLLRYQERERLEKMFKEHLHLSVTTVDASKRFLSELHGVVDPEKKRKIIGREFISAFEEATHALEKTLGEKPKFLVQGTLYPDVIESSPGFMLSTTIKSHHNVGGLPEKMNLKLIEPLRDLFKDEVRKLGRELNVPDVFLKRHPFPGPGLAVRVMGSITQERLDVLKLADEIYIQGLRDAGLYDQIWQAFAVLLPVQTVGVRGDGRSYEDVIALRAVTSVDGMTADAFAFTHEFLNKISTKICNEVKGVSRVVYDITSKPPATIEWE